MNKNQTRPFIGIIILGGYNDFFVPLASPKAKHELMSNKKMDIYKIADGKLGVLNFNNMLPIPKTEIIFFNINIENNDNNNDIKYKTLLRNQLNYINDDKQKNVEKAENLYKSYINNFVDNSVINRCCSFRLLEEKCNGWILNKKLK